MGEEKALPFRPNAAEVRDVLEVGAIFGKECAPSYDEVHRLADDSIRYYLRTGAGLEKCDPLDGEFLVEPPENMPRS